MHPHSFLLMFQDALSAYNRMCKPLWEQFEIPQVSFDILMFLNNNPQYCTAQEISQIRNIKKNLVSVHVEKLVQAGLLSRGSVDGDRRKVALSCTEKAEPIIAAGLEMQRDFHDRLTQGISEEKWTAFRETMEIIQENAGKMALTRETEAMKTC